MWSPKSLRFKASLDPCHLAAGMDNSLGKTLVVEMVGLECWSVVSWVGLQTIADLLSRMPILEQCRAILVFGGDSEPMVRV